MIQHDQTWYNLIQHDSTWFSLIKQESYWSNLITFESTWWNKNKLQQTRINSIKENTCESKNDLDQILISLTKTESTRTSKNHFDNARINTIKQEASLSLQLACTVAHYTAKAAELALRLKNESRSIKIPHCYSHHHKRDNTKLPSWWVTTRSKIWHPAENCVPHAIEMQKIMKKLTFIASCRRNGKNGIVGAGPSPGPPILNLQFSDFLKAFKLALKDGESGH